MEPFAHMIPQEVLDCSRDTHRIVRAVCGKVFRWEVTNENGKEVQVPVPPCLDCVEAQAEYDRLYGDWLVEEWVEALGVTTEGAREILARIVRLGDTWDERWDRWCLIHDELLSMQAKDAAEHGANLMELLMAGGDRYWDDSHG